MISIHSIYIGQPRTFNDEHGTWRSSIFRTPVDGPIDLGLRGLAGDEVSDTKNHGSPSQAVCCHSLGHYQFWNEQYGMSLSAGNVGENWTLADADEAEICINDVYRVGTARVRVSGPRVPCGKQARRVGRADWVDLTLKELRTGFYLWVLTPGVVQAGDGWQLEERAFPQATLHALNHCAYHDFDLAVVQSFLNIPDLHAHWRKRLSARLNG